MQTVTIGLSAATIGEVEIIKDRLGVKNRAQVVSEAIQFYFEIVRAWKYGGKVFIEEGGSRVRIVRKQ